ncbi:hypothetical protein MUK42_23942 [Musa troglodytarum]|uniref:Uncharacterized protein n=1 Tax=Musa troglodytarum TaxID=320322 RepID=A0A9E7E9E1_9LILI|nr:hypothetical protein MUK42_23942 [Musa troglodytarum]
MTYDDDTGVKESCHFYTVRKYHHPRLFLISSASRSISIRRLNTLLNPYFPSQRGMSYGDKIFLLYIYEYPQGRRASAAFLFFVVVAFASPPPRSLHPRGCGKMKRKRSDSNLCRGGSRKKRAGRSCHRKFL